MPGRECPRCGRQQPETAEVSKCLFCGADLPPAAAGPQSPPPAERNSPISEAGEPEKRPCPQCGESLYATEHRCWRCGHEFEETPAAPAEAPATQPPAAAPPAAETPAAVAPPPAVPSSVPYYPTTVAPPPAPVNREAQTLGIWSLVLGILGIFCCVGVSGIVAIVLGVRSNRLAQNGFATAGIVLGIIGMIELLVAVASGLIGYFLQGAESLDTTALAPLLHCAVAVARPFLGL